MANDVVPNLLKEVAALADSAAEEKGTGEKRGEASAGRQVRLGGGGERLVLHLGWRGP